MMPISRGFKAVGVFRLVGGERCPIPEGAGKPDPGGPEAAGILAGGIGTAYAVRQFFAVWYPAVSLRSTAGYQLSSLRDGEGDELRAER